MKFELAEAIRTSDIIEPGESGMKLNGLYPQRYAAARAANNGGATVRCGS